MSLRPWLAALALIALAAIFAFSMWAEWGLYAWACAAQIAVTGMYYKKLSFLAVFIACFVPGIPLFNYLKSHAATSIKPIVFAIAVPAMVMLAHLGLSIFYVSTGGKPAQAATLSESIKSPCFMPRNVAISPPELDALDLKNALTITEDKNSSTHDAEVYIALKPSYWPDPQTPVLMNFRSQFLNGRMMLPVLNGTVRLAPAPYLLRNAGISGQSMFVVMYENTQTVRQFWLLPLIMYGIFSIIGIIQLVRYLRGSASAPTTNFTPVSPRQDVVG